MQAGCVQASIESRISCACVSVQLVQAFTHAPAALEADRGGKFHMVDGNVTGEFTDLVSNPPPSLSPPLLSLLRFLRVIVKLNTSGYFGKQFWDLNFLENFTQSQITKQVVQLAGVGCTQQPQQTELNVPGPRETHCYEVEV